MMNCGMHLKLTSLVENLEGQLNYELLEGGEHLSAGERQLICLAVYQFG